MKRTLSLDNAARKRLWMWGLAALCLVTFFANLGTLPTDIMESRNIVTAREIAADGNWLVPTMNGELRLEKPPLPTWVAGAIETACPDNLAAQRAAAGVMGCVWTLYLFLMVRYVSRRDDLAVATTIVFLTCYNVVLMGRTATWDIYCHAFMMAGIYYLMRGLYEQRRHTLWFALAGLMMGLSFLSKGPVSFYALLLPFLIALPLLPHPAMKGKWPAFTLMVAVMLVVGSWWYVYLLIAHPVEVNAVIHKESGAWINRNVRPWYYYWRFFLEMGAWSLLMLAALAVPYWKRRIELKREYLFAIAWALASVVLLSLTPEKKTRYLLPSLAPCSMAVACLIVHFKQGKRLDAFSRWLYRANGLLMAVVILAAPVLLYQLGVKAGLISMGKAAFVSVCLVAIALWLAASAWNYRPMRFIAGIAAVFVLTELFLLGIIGHTVGNPDARSISTLRHDRRVANMQFYHNASEELRIEMVYEAHRKILPLDLSSEQAVKAALPCVLVSQQWAGQEVPPRILSQLDTVAIGTFDDNKFPKTNRHYTTLFLNHVTLLKIKDNSRQNE